MSAKFDIEVTLVELINIEYALTESVSAQGREGRWFDSDCKTIFFFRNNITRVPIFSENFDFMTKSLLLGNNHETH
jgi:hypothetical protein